MPAKPEATRPGATGLHARLAEVYSAVSRVEKRGSHPQGWKFATESDISEMLRKELGARGIVIVPRLARHKAREIGRTQKGAPIWRHTVDVVFEVTDGTESLEPIRWRGQADDASDKGLNKAMTACRKFFLVNLFEVSTGDDPDAHDVQVERPRERRPRREPASEPERPARKAPIPSDPPTPVEPPGGVALTVEQLVAEAADMAATSKGTALALSEDEVRAALREAGLRSSALFADPERCRDVVGKAATEKALADALERGADGAAKPLSEDQRKSLFARGAEIGVEREATREVVREALGHGISEMTRDEYERALAAIETAATARPAGAEPRRDPDDPPAPEAATESPAGQTTIGEDT